MVPVLLAFVFFKAKSHSFFLGQHKFCVPVMLLGSHKNIINPLKFALNCALFLSILHCQCLCRKVKRIVRNKIETVELIFLFRN